MLIVPESVDGVNNRDTDTHTENASIKASCPSKMSKPKLSRPRPA